MLNGKEIKSIKNMIISGTKERPVYSGGIITLNNPVTFDKEVFLSAVSIALRSYFQNI